MRSYTQVFAFLVLYTIYTPINCHRLRYHRPIEKGKEGEEGEHPILARRPYSISKELWFPFGSFGYKRHVSVKRDTEEVTSPVDVREIEIRGGDLDELTRLPVPGIGEPAPGPVLAEPLPADTPIIRPIDAPPVPKLPEIVEPPAGELNTDIKPFINPAPIPPVRPIEENFILPPPVPPAEPPKEPVPVEGFGTYMKKGRELIMDFGRFIFTRMSELLNRARNFRLISSRTVGN